MIGGDATDKRSDKIGHHIANAETPTKDPKATISETNTPYWAPETAVTQRTATEETSEIAESFQVLGQLTESEIEFLIPDDIDDTQAAWSVAADHEALQNVLSGETNQLRLPTPEGWVGQVAKRVRRGNKTTTIMGKLDGAPEDDFLIVAHEGVVFGHVADYSEGMHYELRTAHNGDLLIRQLDQSVRTAVCGIPDEVELPEPVDDSFDTHDEDCPCGAHSAPLAESLEIQSDALNTLDIVVGYSAAARSADGGTAQIEARIISSVDRMNMAFDNSGITPGAVELILLATIEDPFYNDPGNNSSSMSEELGDLNSSSDGDLDTVSDLALHLGADLQAFIVRSTQGSAGIAYRPGRSSITARNYMSSDRITFVHEIGHNIGLKHSWGDTSSDSITSVYNYGWRINGTDDRRYRTVMAYDWGWRRIPYFANPNVNYQGVPTGAVDGYDATGDTRADSRYVSGGYTGNAGAGFDGSNPNLGARNAIYLEERAQFTADNRTRTTAAPIVLTQPPDLTITVGEDAGLSVLAAGEGSLTYQWQKNGSDLIDGGNISGSLTDTLTISSAAISDGGDYTLIVTNMNGSTMSSVATLSVINPVPPSISSQPVSQSRNEGESVSFSVTADGNPEPSYQWRIDESNIPGATASTLTIQSVLPEDAGSYTCLVSNLGGSLSSNSATLTVNARPVVMIDSPSVESASIPENMGLVLEATATDDGAPVPANLVTIWSAVTVPDGEAVIFGDASSEDTTASFTGAGVYLLRFSASDGVIADSRDIRIEVGGSSGIAAGSGVNLERYEGISGNQLSGLLDSQSFINEQPDHTEVLDQLFEASVNVADNYGQRIRGYFIAPQNGDYTFWLSSDDHSQLFLSTDNDPANKTVVVSINGWTKSRQWDKFSTQQSGLIPLVAGEAYYIEVLHKEGGGGDNAAVGVTFPNQTLERPLSANYLARFEGAVFNVGPTVLMGGPYAVTTGELLSLNATVTDDGSSALTLSWSQVSGPGTADFTDATVEDPAVTFDSAGIYRLRLAASDGTLTTFAEVEVMVNTPPDNFTLTMNADIGGEVSPSGSVTVNASQVTVIEAAPAPGYSFVNWTGDTAGIADSNSASTTIQIAGSQTITANFEQNNAKVAPFGQEWKDRAFGEGANGPETELTGDFNNDGRLNVVDFAFQIETMTAGDAVGKLPLANIHTDGGDSYFAIQLRRIEGGLGDPSDDGYEIYGIRYFVECLTSLDLGTWESDPLDMEIVGDPVSNGDGTETVTVRLKDPINAPDSADEGFMRVRVEILP
ncbi:MAG: immunoglobulin domain-containing protein [Verrucomicrobiota bacterium]